MVVPAFVCFIDSLVTSVFSFLTFLALSQPTVSFLKDISAYGKFREEKKRSSETGFFATATRMVDSDSLWVQKRYFTHFYIVGILSVTLVSALFVMSSTNKSNSPPVSALLIALHVCRRLYECLYIHQWRSESKMHVIGYIVGILYYIMLPFVFVKLPCGAPEMESVETAWSKRTSSALLFLVSGVVLWAQYQQHRHHVLLADLRTLQDTKDDKQSYRLPVGGWFCYVACPHYLAEIVMYTALAMLAELEGRQQGERRLMLTSWVMANLTVSALRSHEWYKQNMPNYDQLQRKAIYPFVL